MSLRHPLAKVKGVGASGDGSHHWWLQRLSALALVPLSLWFLFAIVGHIDDDYQSIVNWISLPYVSVLLILYLGFMLFHGQLGIQVVLEDYVHTESVKFCLLMISKAVFLFAGVASIFAILKVSL
jgi:succinate dehydrogenase / fumarate reductase membrane anchor subunit